VRRMTSTYPIEVFTAFTGLHLSLLLKVVLQTSTSLFTGPSFSKKAGKKKPFGSPKGFVTHSCIFTAQKQGWPGSR
jgi:hypothetical protein